MGLRVSLNDSRLHGHVTSVDASAGKHVAVHAVVIVLLVYAQKTGEVPHMRPMPVSSVTILLEASGVRRTGRSRGRGGNCAKVNVDGLCGTTGPSTTIRVECEDVVGDVDVDVRTLDEGAIGPVGNELNHLEDPVTALDCDRHVAHVVLSSVDEIGRVAKYGHHVRE